MVCCIKKINLQQSTTVAIHVVHIICASLLQFVLSHSLTATMGSLSFENAFFIH